MGQRHPVPLGMPELEFEWEYIPPLLCGEKLATTRYALDEVIEEGHVIDLVDPDGDKFAEGWVHHVEEMPLGEVVPYLNERGVPYSSSSAVELRDDLTRIYGRLMRPDDELTVIVFETVKKSYGGD